MFVAFATTDLETVDAHFGSTPWPLVFEVSRRGAREVGRWQLGAAREDGGHDKLAARLEAAHGCVLLDAAAVGPTAAADLRSTGTRPCAVPPGQPIGELLRRLLALLAGAPPPWLRRALDDGGAAAPQERP
jgi:nitrogen fixation protein NifX